MKKYIIEYMDYSADKLKQVEVSVENSKPDLYIKKIANETAIRNGYKVMGIRRVSTGKKCD